MFVCTAGLQVRSHIVYGLPHFTALFCFSLPSSVTNLFISSTHLNLLWDTCSSPANVYNKLTSYTWPRATDVSTTKAQTHYTVAALWPLNSFFLNMPVLHHSSTLQCCHKYIQDLGCTQWRHNHTVTEAFCLYILACDQHVTQTGQLCVTPWYSAPWPIAYRVESSQRRGIFCSRVQLYFVPCDEIRRAGDSNVRLVAHVIIPMWHVYFNTPYKKDLWYAC